MILSDNETKNDLLNNVAIAKTVVSIIKESESKPISIGIHGDWGAGKSSILEMVNDIIDKEEKKYCCIRFNGWKHQGFEDSKVALMSAIVSELVKNQGLLNKCKDTIDKLWKNINWMSLVKSAGKTALAISSGTTPLALLSDVFNSLKEKGSSEEGVTSVVDDIGGYLSDAKVFSDVSANNEFTEFRKNFSKLLEQANIDKLVVLIDDLDRCLPDVAIDTLEAVRLFMFTGETAFVIAADETMIRYAVKKHFPDVQEENENHFGYSFADRYLEKLIQVPFHIPALGDVEACNYIMLLMVGSELGDNDDNYKLLCKEGLNRLKKPWAAEIFTVDNVREILKDSYDRVEEKVLLATQVCGLLSKHTDGNPRKIKRFLNMLLLRCQVANNSGYLKEIDIKILAKMMLAEYFSHDFYKKLPTHLNSCGVWEEYSKIKRQIEECQNDKSEKIKLDDNWFELKHIKDWILSDPKLDNVDLRPYYYACKEKKDYFAGRSNKDDLAELVDILIRSEFTIKKHMDEIENLSDEDASRLFDIIQQKIMESGNLYKKPRGIDGIVTLVQKKEFLREKLIQFIKALPKKQVGIWIKQGWNKAIPKDYKEYDELHSYLNTLDNKTLIK